MLIVLSIWISLFIFTITDMMLISREVRSDLTEKIKEFDEIIKAADLEFDIYSFEEGFFGVSFEFFTHFFLRTHKHIIAKIMENEIYTSTIKIELRSGFITIVEQIILELHEAKSREEIEAIEAHKNES